MEPNITLEQRLERIESLLLSQKTVFSLDEVAEYTGISKSYLYKLTSRSDIPHYKPSGKFIYFSKEEIDQWLLSNKVKTHTEVKKDVEFSVLLQKHVKNIEKQRSNNK